ncbi:hypothetical protein OK006_1434 [Actinobacteria bacterium OK006]|nr:hypothetical protein OK006_1434 [Actinobacteria bacterium OK006]
MAPLPPIFVAAQPGSTALESTWGHFLATASMRAVTWNFDSEYAWEPCHGRVAHWGSRRVVSPLWCMPELR